MQSVLQAIARMKANGLSVMFYPFILMDIQPGNGLSDPWTGALDQPAVPWRGRITLAKAPGRTGSSDKTAAAAAEVAAFFGEATAGDFRGSGHTVEYEGPAEWSYRRFVLHYAHLCALAGGVDAFCIGSEMRGLTHIRDSADGYPAVRALVELADEVRAILGPDTKIGYAADWSEYFGHQPGDGSGDVLYHLDPLWASPSIDFIGIDNYMPLSDWRDGTGHADAGAGSIYDLAYLKGNVAGGEGYDWYYADAEGRAAQERVPISDGAYGEDWVFRYKDLVSWWSNPHVNRLGGVKVAAPTAWQPRSKPIWFTELGCPAVNKGTNQPNVFHDPKSSESFFPYFSNGCRDDFIQHRYLQAMFAHWNDPANNPVSHVYGGRMVDMGRAHVWAWDARPWPDFPEPDGDLGRWRELRDRALAERPRQHRVAGRGRGGDLRPLRAERVRSHAAPRRCRGIPDRGAGDGAAEPPAADVGLCLRQLRGGRRADLRQSWRSGGGGDHGRRPGFGRPRAGGYADAFARRRDGGAGHGRLRPGGDGLSCPARSRRWRRTRRSPARSRRPFRSCFPKARRGRLPSGR